ncbi:MAG: hypothetical protein U5K30_12360 [Acidimicrobiales bacterium]|nr:hypothetical protein [Acidimicrobiales bacterium]
MTVSHLRPALVLAVWTFLVWTTRIRNIWTDNSLTTGGQVWRTALALAFTAFAVATVAAWARARRAAPWSASGWLVRAFALWTTGVWVVRAVQIANADHDLAFVLVHTALAVVSIVLAVWADRRANRADRASRPTGSRPARV